MATKRRWSTSETKDLVKLVEEHPHNFMEAFRIHAENTGRSVNAVRFYFSAYRRKAGAQVCMATVSKKAMGINRKNISRKSRMEPTPVRESKWKRILKILFE